MFLAHNKRQVTICYCSYLFTVTISASVLTILPNKLAQEPFFFFFFNYSTSPTLWGMWCEEMGNQNRFYVRVCMLEVKAIYIQGSVPFLSVPFD